MGFFIVDPLTGAMYELPEKVTADVHSLFADAPYSSTNGFVPSSPTNSGLNQNININVNVNNQEDQTKESKKENKAEDKKEETKESKETT